MRPIPRLIDTKVLRPAESALAIKLVTEMELLKLKTIARLHAIARRGAVFRIERRGAEYFAQWTSPVVIYPCSGSRDPVAEAALGAAFETGDGLKVTRLYRSDDIPPERCWVRAPGWCLAYS